MAAQPVLRGEKSVTGSRTHQASVPSDDTSQNLDLDGINVMFGEMLGEEESQWKHELYDLKIAKVHTCFPHFTCPSNTLGRQ